jgi:hypothetical protein
VLLSQLFVDADIEKRGREIAKSCTETKWSRSMLDCLGSAAKQDLGNCIAKLTEAQQVAWIDMQSSWYGGGMGGMPLPPGQQPDPVAVVDCNSAIGDAARFPPAIGVADANRSLAISLRAWSLNQACVTWAYDKRACLTNATTTEEVGPCLADDKDVATRIAATDALVKKVAAKRAHGNEITCAAVVSLHYGDTAFKAHQITDKKVIADARDRMLNACTDESWSDDLRACVAVDGGDACFIAAGVPPLWGYPPGGGLPITGVPECDAYGAATARFMVCPSAPQETRDAYKQQFEQYAYAIKSMKQNQKVQYAEACRMQEDSLNEISMQLGCP